MQTMTLNDNRIITVKHRVFDLAVDGMDVIDKIESVGSQSGRTAQPVVVKACGELDE